MTAAALPIGLLAYVAGIVLVSVSLANRSTLSRNSASVAWVVAWIAHLAAIIAFIVREGRLPLATMGEYLLTLGWVVLTLHLGVWFRQRMDVAGLVLPPIAALSGFGAWALLSVEPSPTKSMPQSLFLFHTSVATVGMAMLCVAFAMSLLYLLQDRALKQHKKLGLIERLPALSKCDRIGFHAMLIGFVMLSLGIGTGVMVNASMRGTLWITGPKQVFATLAWVVFAGLLVSRGLLGYRGRKSAYLTIAGFALGLMTVLGMTL